MNNSINSKDIIIHVPDIGEFNKLMKLYKSKGWKHYWNRDNDTYGEYITIGDNFLTGNRYGFYNLIGYKVITVSQFEDKHMNNSLEPDTTLLDRMHHSYKRYMSVQLPFTPDVAVWTRWIRR